MKKFLILLLMLAVFKARSQNSSSINIDHFDRGTAVSLNADYDAPVGSLGNTFKPTANYGISLKTFNDNFIINYSVGYEVFKPKLDPFYYQVTSTSGGVDKLSNGTISYQNFNVFSAYLGFAYNFRVTNQFWIFTGVNLGAYFTHFAYHSSDVTAVNTVDLHEEDLYAAPKAGVTFAMSNDLLFSLESRYNFFAPTGDASDNDRVGTLYQSISTGLTFTYKF